MVNVHVLYAAGFIIGCATIIESCPELQECEKELDNFFNLTSHSNDLSVIIPYCLDIVSKQGTIKVCENKAVTNCGLGGFEPEYRTFKKRKFEAREECLKDCETMDQVKICLGYIEHDIIQRNGYSEYCKHYQEIKTTCVETKLSTCSYRDKLFESGLSADGKRIVQNICNSGCESIDKTIENIESCKKQHSVGVSDQRFSDCRFYNEYISCIQNLPSCTQFRTVAQYYTPELQNARTKCEPQTTSRASTVTPSTMVYTTDQNTEETVPPTKTSYFVKAKRTYWPSSQMMTFPQNTEPIPNGKNFTMTTNMEHHIVPSTNAFESPETKRSTETLTSTNDKLDRKGIPTISMPSTKIIVRTKNQSSDVPSTQAFAHPELKKTTETSTLPNNKLDTKDIPTTSKPSTQIIVRTKNQSSDGQPSDGSTTEKMNLQQNTVPTTNAIPLTMTKNQNHNFVPSTNAFESPETKRATETLTSTNDKLDSKGIPTTSMPSTNIIVRTKHQSSDVPSTQAFASPELKRTTETSTSPNNKLDTKDIPTTSKPSTQIIVRTKNQSSDGQPSDGSTTEKMNLQQNTVPTTNAIPLTMTKNQNHNFVPSTQAFASPELKRATETLTSTNDKLDSKGIPTTSMPSTKIIVRTKSQSSDDQPTDGSTIEKMNLQLNTVPTTNAIPLTMTTNKNHNIATETTKATEELTTPYNKQETKDTPTTSFSSLSTIVKTQNQSSSESFMNPMLLTSTNQQSVLISNASVSSTETNMNTPRKDLQGNTGRAFGISKLLLVFQTFCGLLLFI